MQNGIATSKKITVYDEENIWHGAFWFNRTDSAFLSQTTRFCGQLGTTGSKHFWKNKQKSTSSAFLDKYFLPSFHFLLEFASAEKNKKLSYLNSLSEEKDIPEVTYLPHIKAFFFFFLNKLLLINICSTIYQVFSN